MDIAGDLKAAQLLKSRKRKATLLKRAVEVMERGTAAKRGAPARQLEEMRRGLAAAERAVRISEKAVDRLARPGVFAGLPVAMIPPNVFAARAAGGVK